jgi:hypothetical protein
VALVIRITQVLKHTEAKLQLFHGRQHVVVSLYASSFKNKFAIFAVPYLGSEREATQLVGDEGMLDEENLQDISRAALQQGQLEPRNLIAGANRTKAS